MEKVWIMNLVFGVGNKYCICLKGFFFGFLYWYR